jgi:xylulokinase
VPFKKTDALHNVASLPSGIPGRYLMCNTQETAGGCLNYLRDNVFYPGDGLDGATAPDDFHVRLNQLVADTEPGCGRLLFLPHLFGERCPVDDHRARAAWVNQSLQTRRAHLARAVYEGVAYNARWLLTYVERFTGRRMDGLRLIGGGARSDVWCQIFADILDRPIHGVADPILANARGAALQACVALGEAGFERAGDLVPVERTYEPNPDLRGIYDELFAAYLDAYQRLKPLHRRLNP